MDIAEIDLAPVKAEDDKATPLREAACHKIMAAPVGERNATLNREAFLLGPLLGAERLDFKTTWRTLHRAACANGLEEREVHASLKSGLLAGIADSPPTNLDACVETFRRHLHLPDDASVLATLGAARSNQRVGDPVWLLLVGGSSAGKTAVLDALTGLPKIYDAGTLTEGSLLSGTSVKERSQHARGRLLREVGEFGILLCKDFGSVLSMNRDTRGALLAALHEVYDGSWTRWVGTDGGQKLRCEGKLGLIEGCTPALDRYHGVMGVLGERFLLHRLPAIDRSTRERTAMALERGKVTRSVREELAGAVRRLFERRFETPDPLSPQERAELALLADFVALARSPVERDGYSRDIVAIPHPEAGPRLALQLRELLHGLCELRASRRRSWEIVRGVAFDSMPAVRLRLLQVLRESARDTPDIVDLRIASVDGEQTARGPRRARACATGRSRQGPARQHLGAGRLDTRHHGRD